MVLCCLALGSSHQQWNWVMTIFRLFRDLIQNISINWFADYLVLWDVQRVNWLHSHSVIKANAGTRIKHDYHKNGYKGGGFTVHMERWWNGAARPVVLEVNTHLLLGNWHAEYKLSPRLVEENEICLSVKHFHKVGGGHPPLTRIFSDDLQAHPWCRVGGGGDLSFWWEYSQHTVKSANTWFYGNQVWLAVMSTSPINFSRYMMAAVSKTLCVRRVWMGSLDNKCFLELLSCDFVHCGLSLEWDKTWVCGLLSQINRFSLGPIGDSKRGRDGSRGGRDSS